MKTRTWLEAIAVILILSAPCACRGDDEDIRWIDGKDIPTEGLAFSGEPRELPYDRLPLSAKGRVTDGVWWNARSASGIQFRFATDSKTLRIRWCDVTPGKTMPIQALSGTSGIDVYHRPQDGGKWEYGWTGFPKNDPKTHEYGGELVIEGLSNGEYVVNAPLYNGLKSLAVGIDAGAAFGKVRPRANGAEKPIVFYGTSSTQGAAASRPGLAFTALIGRNLDIPVVNLGFSGSGKMEMEMVDYVAAIDACCYVIDTPGNMSPKLVRERYEKFVRELHRRRPSVPLVLAENRHYRASPNPIPGFAEVMRPLAARLRAEGWKLAYIRTEDMFPTDIGDTSVEGGHPNDFGMKQLAASYGKAIREALAQTR